jgi:hypothetical protein
MKLKCEKSSLGSGHYQANQRTLIQPKLARFDKNKKKLLQKPIDGQKGGAATAIYDTKESWALLRRVAEGYLSHEQMRISATSNAQMAKDFTNLKRELSDARALLMKEDVFFGLVRATFHARYTQAPIAVLKADPLVASKILGELTEAASHIRKLEMAASRAAANARRKAGRPKSGSTILPSDYIVGLARLYRDATGRVPGAGEGPFGFFLVEFLNAVGRRNLASRSVFNLIIPARETSLATDPNSPFKR